MVEIQEVEEVEKSWSDLPGDILSLIKSHLFARDYDAFSSVCRSWRSTYCPVKPFPPLIDCPYRSSPCLMFIQQEDDMSIFFHPIYNDSYSMDVPEIYDTSILSSNYGWLLLSIDSYIFFFNPFTGQEIVLPNMPYEYTSVCFTSPPTSDDCMVIGFASLYVNVEVGILRRGQQNWDNHSYRMNEEFWCSGCNPVLFNKLYYVLGSTGKIGVFDPDNLSWDIFAIPYDYELEGGLIRRSFLAELDGRLVAACFSRDRDNAVPFFSLDLSKKVWKSELGIGEKVMYASCGSTFFRRDAIHGMNNKIYFPFYSEKKVVFYCLATKSFHSFGGDVSPIEKKMMREKSSAWIEPNFESVDDEKLIWCKYGDIETEVLDY